MSYTKKQKWAEMIVESFNKKYQIGSTVNWRNVADDDFPYMQMTTRSKAFVSNSFQPVVFFKERSCYCSIDPIFIS